MARLSSFRQETFNAICERIADGESLRSICASKDMPALSTVMLWIARDESGKLSEQYARARETQADAIFDECLHIADTAEDVQQARLRIDTRKWMAGKLRPKKYGERQQLEHSGPDGGAIPTAIQVTVVDPKA